MREIKHLLDALLIDEDFKTKFCQICQFDSSQKALKRRLEENVDDNVLDSVRLRALQRLMRNYNLYVQAFKACDDRIKKSSNSRAKIHLKQHDSRRIDKSTHNKSTFSEIAIVMIISNNIFENQFKNKDILIQNIHENDFLRVSY